jgi:hypothetical protein
MQAQADFLDIYRPITDAAAETLKTALRNMERLNEQQLEWVRAAQEQNGRLANRLAEVRSINDLCLAQSQFAFSQVTQGIEGWWRLFRAMQDSQLEAMSRMEAQAGQAAERREEPTIWRSRRSRMHPRWRCPPPRARGTASSAARLR